MVDGKSIKAAGSVGGLGQFLDGEAVPVSLAIDAPSYLDEKVGLQWHRPHTKAIAFV